MEWFFITGIVLVILAFVLVLIIGTIDDILHSLLVTIGLIAIFIGALQLNQIAITTCTNAGGEYHEGICLKPNSIINLEEH